MEPPGPRVELNNQPIEQQEQGNGKLQLPSELHCEWLKFMPTPNAVKLLPKLGRQIFALNKKEVKKKWRAWQTLCLRYNRAHYNASNVPGKMLGLAMRTAQIRGEWTPMIEIFTKCIKSRIDEELQAKAKQRPAENDDAVDGEPHDEANNVPAAVSDDDEPDEPAPPPPAEFTQEQLLLQKITRNQWRLDELKTGHGLVVRHDSNMKYQEEFLANDLSEVWKPKFNKRGFSEELLARLDAQFHSWGSRKIPKKMKPFLASWGEVFKNWNAKLAECKSAISAWQKHLDSSMIHSLKNSPSMDPNQSGTANNPPQYGIFGGRSGTRKRKYCPVLTCAQVDQIAYDGFAIKRRRRIMREAAEEEVEEEKEEEEWESDEEDEEEEDEEEDVEEEDEEEEDSEDDEEDEEDEEEENDEEWQTDEEEDEEEEDDDEGAQLWQLFLAAIRVPLPPLPPPNQVMDDDDDDVEEGEEKDYDHDEEVEYLGF